MTIKIGDVQEICTRTITVKEIALEDMAALNDAFDAKNPEWTGDFTLNESKFDDLLNIFENDWADYRMNHDHSFVFNEEFMLAVRPLLSRDDLNEIYFIQGVGY